MTPLIQQPSPPTMSTNQHKSSPKCNKSSPSNDLAVQPSPSSANHSSSSISSSSNSTPSLIQSLSPTTTTTTKPPQQQQQQPSQIPNYQHRPAKSTANQPRQSVSRTNSLSSSSTSQAISAATTATVHDDDEPLLPIVQSPPFPVELSIPTAKSKISPPTSPCSPPPPVLLPRMRNYNSNIRQPKNYNRAPPNASDVRSSNIISEMNHLYQQSPFMQRRIVPSDVIASDNTASAGGAIGYTLRSSQPQYTSDAIYSNLGKIQLNKQNTHKLC